MNSNKQFLIFFLSTISFLTLFSGEALTQWQQTQGPYGGSFQFLSYADNELFAGTYQGNVFKYSNGEWQFISNVQYAKDLTKFDSKLFVLSDYGFYKSNNDGEDWELEMEGNASCHFENNGILYVSVEDTIYKTVDGENWEDALIGTDANTILFGEPTVQQLIDINAFSIIDSIALLGCTTSVYPIPQGVYVSTNSGMDWFLPESVEDPTWATAFAKLNDDHYFASNRGVSKSTDNGLTWSYVNSGLPENSYISKMIIDSNTLYALTNSPRAIYKLMDTSWVNIDLGFEPAGFTLGGGKIFISAENKIYMSELDNFNLIDITEGLIASNVTPYALNDDIVLAVGNNEIYKTIDGGDNWIAQGGQYFSKFLVTDNLLFGIGDGIFTSSDQGESWQSTNSGIPSSHVGYENAIAATVNKIYVGYSKTRARMHLPPVWEAGGIYTSTNNGESWVSASTGIPTQGNVRAPIYLLYSSSNHVIARTAEGYYRSIDEGNSWSLFESGLPEFTFPIRIQSFMDRLYCITSKGIYYSDANETEWKSAGEGLPGDSDPLYYYGLNLVSFKEKLYAVKSGPEQLLYYLINAQWEPVNSELPTNADFINYSVSDNVIYGGARDAGIWKGNFDQATNINVENTYTENFLLSQNYPNPFNPTTIINYTIPNSPSFPLLGKERDLRVRLTTLKVYDILGSEIVTLVNEQKLPGTYEVEFNGEGLSSGIYFYRIRSGEFIQERKMILLK